MLTPTINNPLRSEWFSLCLRPTINSDVLQQQVADILAAVKTNGDRALLAYTQQYDGIQLKQLQLSTQHIESSASTLSSELKKAIDQAAANIRLFHQSQHEDPKPITTSPGVVCWQKNVAIESVGLYIPGGSAPLFSTVLMLAIPAQIAGCKEIILCTPPDASGSIHPAICYAAKISGVTQIFTIGGAQSIAAMAYGTESVPKVHKIFGPGNQYVTKAKQLVQQDGVAIDIPAGPSEVLIIADSSAVPAFVAADLLSQAEHGPDSQVVLIATDEDMLEQCKSQVTIQLNALPRLSIAQKALSNSRFIRMNRIEDAIDFSNEYAPEHLILVCNNPEEHAQKIRNAGSVFLGNYSPESAGDYASGTNHTLPTSGFSKAYSGVSLASFIKKITFQKLTPEGLRNLAPTIEAMAEAEGLIAHKNAVSIRFNSLISP